MPPTSPPDAGSSADRVGLDGARDATLFASVVATAEAVAGTSSRTAKITRLAQLLRSLAADEVEPAVGFLTASVRQGRLGVGWRTLTDLSVEPAATASLSIAKVDAAISRLAAAGGAGSAAARTEELARLWARATAEEQRLLSGILLGEVRIGALEGVLTDAVAKASERPLEEVRRAAMLTGSLGRTAYLAGCGPACRVVWEG